MSAPHTNASHEFPITRWSVFGAARGVPIHDRERAHEHVCEVYWKPLYAYARARGHSPEDAEDRTQDFLLHFIDTGALERANPERGRFRSLLRTSFRNFISGQWRRSAAAKRGGPQRPASLDIESELSNALSDSGASPDVVFDRSWAQSHIDASLRRLSETQANRGMGVEFATLRPFLTGEATGTSLRDAAGQIGLTYSAARRRLTRLRADFRVLLRETVAATLGPDDDLDAELRYLIACLREAPGPGSHRP